MKRPEPDEEAENEVKGVAKKGHDRAEFEDDEVWRWGSEIGGPNGTIIELFCVVRNQSQMALRVF